MKPLSLIAAAALAALLLLAAACDDDEEEVTTPSPTPTEAATASPAASPTASAEPFEGSSDPVERPDPAVPPVALLVDVRVAAHEGFDRVAFEFADNFPGYRIEYVEPPIVQDGSGLEVEIEGQAFLQVRFSAAQAHDEAGNPTIDVRELTPGLSAILELEQTGDFEGYVTWVIGLPGQLDFRVSDLTDPNRVVVDIAQP